MALGVENAAPYTFIENVAVRLNVTRANATNNDVLTMLSAETVGCNGAANSSTKFTLSKDMNTVDIMIQTAGIYKVCYAPEGGNSSNDYVELGDRFTVTPQMAGVVVDYASDFKVSRSTQVNMRFNYNPDMAVNGMITYSKVSAIGCDTALASEVVASKFTTPSISVLGVYKLCFNRTDTGQTINVVERNITTISAKSTRSTSSIIATSDQAELVAIHGAALSIRLNESENNVQKYDSVAVVAATTENCKSSASNAVQILHIDESVLIPPEKLPSDTGMAKVCFAPFGNINLTDNAFLEQGIQVEIIDPELTVMTYKTEPPGGYSFLG